MSELRCDEPGCTYVLTDEWLRLGAMGLHRKTDGGDTCRGSASLASRAETTKQKPRKAA